MVELVKMSKQEFEQYVTDAISEYAKEKVKAGTWAEEEADKLSKEEFNTLLPEDVDTKNQYLFSIVEGDQSKRIGYLWFQYTESLRYREAFLYDFKIFEEYRGKGYGKQSMYALEKVVKKLNVNKISLHVFSHNKRAIELYKKVGFIDIDIIMSKML